MKEKIYWIMNRYPINEQKATAVLNAAEELYLYFDHKSLDSAIDDIMKLLDSDKPIISLSTADIIKHQP